MVRTTGDAPTVEDAQRSADVLAESGAGRVVLFGSVAKGDATEQSDIDLIAIYDDIDYNERGEIADRLRPAAADAAGFPVDVLVTDRPEWEMRTTRVVTSLEAAASRSGVLLVDRRPGRVAWSKEMVMPTTDYQEGLYRLGRVHDAVAKLVDSLDPGRLEAIYTDQGNTEGAVLAQIARMLRLGGAAQAVTEQSVKAIIHVTGRTAVPQSGHRIERLCATLPDETRLFVERLSHPPGPEAITPWHWWERYHRLGKDPDPTPALVEPVIRAAGRVATYAAGYFGADKPAELVRKCAEDIESYLDTHDLTTGRQLP